MDVVIVHHADQVPCGGDVINDLARPGALLVQCSPLACPEAECLVLQCKLLF